MINCSCRLPVTLPSSNSAAVITIFIKLLEWLICARIPPTLMSLFDLLPGMVIRIYLMGRRSTGCGGSIGLGYPWRRAVENPAVSYYDKPKQIPLLQDVILFGFISKYFGFLN